jgi:hypothetical protein
MVHIQSLKVFVSLALTQVGFINILLLRKTLARLARLLECWLSNLFNIKINWAI